MGKHSSQDGADSHPLVAWALSDREAPFGGYATETRGSTSDEPGTEGPVGWPGRDDDREGAGVGWPGSELAADGVDPEPADPARSRLAHALAAELAAPPRQHTGESTAASATGLLTEAPRKGWRRFFGGAA